MTTGNQIIESFNKNFNPAHGLALIKASVVQTEEAINDAKNDIRAGNVAAAAAAAHMASVHILIATEVELHLISERTPPSHPFMAKIADLEEQMTGLINQAQKESDRYQEMPEIDQLDSGTAYWYADQKQVRYTKTAIEELTKTMAENGAEFREPCIQVMQDMERRLETDKLCNHSNWALNKADGFGEMKDRLVQETKQHRQDISNLIAGYASNREN